VASPSAAARDSAIAAAVAEGRRADQVVVALKPRRSSGSFLAVAAAVLVVLLFAGFLVGQLDDRGTEDSASNSGDRGGAEGADESGAASATDQAAAETDTDTAEDGFSDAAIVDLGAVADETTLRAALVASGGLDPFDASPTTRSTLPATAPPEDTEAVPGDSETCQVGFEESDPVLAGLLLEGTATYAGTPAVVYVFATVDGDTRVQVVTAATCQTLVAFPL